MDSKTILGVIKVKVVLSSTLVKVAAIDKMQSEWESDDEVDLKTKWMSLNLACEYSTFELEASQHVCSQILNLPPPYDIGNPDERLHQFYELQVRLQRVESSLIDLCQAISTLVDTCEDARGAIREVQRRAADALHEVQEIQDSGETLAKAVAERLLEQLAGVSLGSEAED